MTMSFLLHDSLSETESTEIGRPSGATSGKQRVSVSTPVSLIEEKFHIPGCEQVLERERLFELLNRSVKQYGATLISGRAGTGKTVLAAGFARRQASASWFSIEPADSDWREFSSSFIASLFGPGKKIGKSSRESSPSEAEHAELLTKCFNKLGHRRFKGPRLIVLDNVHHLFDVTWFSGFFRQLIMSLNGNVRLVMLCRSKPSAPLWRMRSKQMLNVIEENLLYFSESEAKELCRLRGLPEELGAAAYKRSFGRAANLTKQIDDLAARP